MSNGLFQNSGIIQTTFPSAQPVAIVGNLADVAVDENGAIAVSGITVDSLSIGDVGLKPSLPSANFTMHTGTTAISDGIDLNVDGYTTAIIRVSGTFKATINFLGTSDNIYYNPVMAYNSVTELPSTKAQVSGIYYINCVGIKKIRVRVDVYYSGTVTVTGIASVNAPKTQTARIVNTSSVPAITRKTLSAYPKKPLDYSVINSSTYGTVIHVSSIGFDGSLYGYSSLKKIFRTADAFATALDYGQDFSGLIPSTSSLLHVFQTHAGYVVIETDSTTKRGGIWFSTTFTSGFTKIVEMDRGYPIKLNTSIYNAGVNQTVILCGEYVITSPNPASGGLRLFGSFDGGATWVSLKETVLVDSVYNSHWHASTYDPYAGRIYAQTGDATNAMLYYSEDLGQNWNEIRATDENGVLPQPTTLISFPDIITALPDRGYPPCVLSIKKDTNYKDINGEKFLFSLDYSIYPAFGTGAGKYTGRPIAQDGIEAYFQVPTVTGHQQIFVVGTADGGQTWHTVLVLNLSRYASGNANEGIVGPDKNGFLYMYYNDNGAKIAKITKQNWIYS